MRLVRELWLVAATVTVAGACAPAVVTVAGRPAPTGATVVASVRHSGAGFGVQAAPKSVADVSHYVFRLYNVGLATVAATHQTTATTFSFLTVPDGTYSLKAEAFGAGPVSITQGGEQTSPGTATVASPTVTYSVGASLAVTVPLLNGTGETIANTASVVNGTAWAGVPVGAP